MVASTTSCGPETGRSGFPKVLPGGRPSPRRLPGPSDHAAKPGACSLTAASRAPESASWVLVGHAITSAAGRAR